MTVVISRITQYAISHFVHLFIASLPFLDKLVQRLAEFRFRRGCLPVSVQDLAYILVVQVRPPSHFFDGKTGVVYFAD